MGAGVTAHSMLVRVLPPSDCFRMRVSLLSRYGMNTGFEPFVCCDKGWTAKKIHQSYFTWALQLCKIMLEYTGRENKTTQVSSTHKTICFAY